MARQQVAGALARALGEALEDPELQAKVAAAHDAAAARDGARSFTPYDGPNRRTIAELLQVAATAMRSEPARRGRRGRLILGDDLEPPPGTTLPAAVRARLLAKDALSNLGGAAVWSDAPLPKGGRQRRARLDGDQSLEAARMVVRYGLGRCIRCGRAEAVARTGQSPFYCATCRVGRAEDDRAQDRDRMHACIERCRELLPLAHGTTMGQCAPVSSGSERVPAV